MKIKIFKINENVIKPTFVGKIKFSELEKIAQLTYRTDNDEIFFQRPTDKARAESISTFISSKLLDGPNLKKQSDITTLFPTAIILAIDGESASLEGDYIVMDDEKSAFIVDGQHRFVGIKRFYESSGLTYNDLDLELPIAILFGYDFYEQATVFVDVNFKQKKVNKSFYYDIFGSLPGDRNEMRLAHLLVKHLNENTDSPFFGMIKMLGMGDGVISQSFLVESIMGLFRPNKFFSELYYDFANGKNTHKDIAKILTIYFSVIKDHFNEYYPVKNSDGKYSVFNQDILFKTTGVGAVLKLLNDFKPHIKNINNEQGILELFNDRFSLINRGQAEDLFSRNGSFAKSAGGGLQSGLYSKLKMLLRFDDSRDSFISHH